MEGEDTEMMEAAEMSLQREVAPDSSHDDVVRNLLTLARQLVTQGKPSQALQAVVVAMKTKGGDEAVFRSLHHACELYRSRLQENAAVDKLASLFAECAIAQAQPIEAEISENEVAGLSVISDAHGTSILAETGRMQVVLDAVLDGSNFICLKCGGLVSNHRKEEHAYWCC